MEDFKLYISADDNEIESVSRFIKKTIPIKKSNGLNISKLRRKRFSPISDPSLSTIAITIISSATAAAIVKGLFELIKEYIRIRFEKEKINREANSNKAPLIFRVGDREVSIPAHIEAEERNRLLKIVEQGLMKQISEKNGSQSD